MIESKQKGRNYAENLYVILFLVNIATLFWLFEVMVVVYRYSFKTLVDITATIAYENFSCS